MWLLYCNVILRPGLDPAAVNFVRQRDLHLSKYFQRATGDEGVCGVDNILLGVDSTVRDTLLSSPGLCVWLEYDSISSSEVYHYT